MTAGLTDIKHSAAIALRVLQNISEPVEVQKIVLKAHIGSLKVYAEAWLQAAGVLFFKPSAVKKKLTGSCTDEQRELILLLRCICSIITCSAIFHRYQFNSEPHEHAVDALRPERTSIFASFTLQALMWLISTAQVVTKEWNAGGFAERQQGMMSLGESALKRLAEAFCLVSAAIPDFAESRSYTSHLLQSTAGA